MKPDARQVYDMAVPRGQYPAGIARDHARRLAKLADSYKEVAVSAWNNNITRGDAIGLDEGPTPDDLERFLSLLEQGFALVLTEKQLEELVKNYVLSLRRFTLAQVSRQVTKVLGFDPLIRDTTLEQLSALAVRHNIDLIKSIPTVYHDRIRDVVYSWTRQGKSTIEIVKEIERLGGVTRSRAILIARDQTGKFYGDVTRARHQSLGLKSYRWRTSRDERVRGNPTGHYPNARPSHWARDGQIYTWAEGADGEHPGQPIQCRCHAEIVEEELLESWEPAIKTNS